MLTHFQSCSSDNISFALPCRLRSRKVSKMLATILVSIAILVLIILSTIFLIIGVKNDAKTRRSVTGVLLLNMAATGPIILFYISLHAYYISTYNEWPRDPTNSSQTLCITVQTIAQSGGHIFPDLLILLSITSLIGSAPAWWKNTPVLLKYLIVSIPLWTYNALISYFTTTKFGIILLFDRKQSYTWCQVTLNFEEYPVIKYVPFYLITISIIICLTIFTCRTCSSMQTSRNIQANREKDKLNACTRANIYWVILNLPGMLIAFAQNFGHFPLWHPSTILLSQIFGVMNIVSYFVAMLTFVKNIPSLCHGVCPCLRPDPVPNVNMEEGNPLHIREDVA